ncbi:hypothetical protein DOY81_000427 [Sarcophaga bullata]|nr:hypothetical protein DOY81_000427 [Sarcophaga bullata]
MFFSCFKCKDNDDNDDFRQRPRTRNALHSIPQKIVAPPITVPELVPPEDADNVAAKSIKELQEEVLAAHNEYRAKHSCGPLVLNKQLNNLASEWAKHLANTNTLQHRKNNKYGENLYMSTGIGKKTHVLAVQSWYEEVQNYNFNRPGFSPNTGHFSQVVWKTTKELGVGVATKGDRTWVVCNYDPPGNIVGNFLDCVPDRIEEKLVKIIERMKTKRKFLDWKKDIAESRMDMAIDPASFEANDLKLWTRFELECLDKHNYYRAIHGVPSLKLNRQLCNLADQWSQHLARSNSISHRPDNEYGENIYYASNFDPTAEQCVQSWYNEVKHYKYSKPGFSSNTGHFTQLVWKDTQELGVGLTKVDGITFVVCNYSPAGNVMDQYQEQVLAPIGKRKSLETFRRTTRKEKDKELVKSSFEEVCLDSHNSYRAMHGSPPLTLNTNLNFLANDWAQHLATQKEIVFRKNNRFGENIFFTPDQVLSGREPVEFWYSGIRHYNFQTNNVNASTHSFTQVIWKSSELLGVGVAKVGQSSYVVCNYRPKGNNPADFIENVLPVGTTDNSSSSRISLMTSKLALLYSKHLPPHHVDIFTVHMLRSHNVYRSRHGCSDLKLSHELMMYARRCANRLNQNNTFLGVPSYVLSIYCLKTTPAAEDIVDDWYNEIDKYDFKHPQYMWETRHFTQLVWKSTKFMGVALNESADQTMAVVSYEPAGNIEGQYAENVPEPI